MGRFLVMDVVFQGSSLNYDQGSGNYQELKKITRWDGRQYTLVSRYALRYSMLNDSEIFKQNELAPGSVFIKDTGEQSKGDVFNPKPETLFNGEILKYPEFDLFGYLVTKSEPTQSRTAPVRISHAISMTPFYYDAHFSGNHWIAQRALKAGLTTKLEPNLFTAEEHNTYYIYTVVVDVDQVGRFSVFTTKEEDVKILKQGITIEREENGFIEGKMKLTLQNKGTIDVDVKIVPIYKPEEGKSGGKKGKSGQKKPVLYEIQYDLGEEVRKERVLKLVNAILNLKRNIKGRPEDLSPKLLVLGVYKNIPYQTFKDRIQLLDEHSEEEYDEIEEREENGKKIVRIKHVVSKSKKPVFQIVGLPLTKDTEATDRGPKNGTEEPNESNENTIVSELEKSKVLEEIKKLFETGEQLSEVKVFKDPGIEVRLK